MSEAMFKCRLCEHLCIYKFSKKILGKYQVSYFECSNCLSLQTESPYWLNEAYGEQAEKYDTGKASRTLENFFNLPSLCNHLQIDASKPSVDWGGGGGLFTRLMRDIGYNFFCFDSYLKSEFAIGFLWSNQSGYTPLITAFEVVEHFEEPSIEWGKIFKLNPDFLICSTEIYSQQGEDWFYLSPHNGQHIFFYSEFSLALIAQCHGYVVYNIGRYIIFCKIPLLPTQLDFISYWSNNLKEFQNKSFSAWNSQPFHFAIQDHNLLSHRHAVSTQKCFVIIDMIFFQLNNSGIARLWESLIKVWSKTDFGDKLIILDRAKTAPRISGLRYIDIPAYNHENKDADCKILEQICQENHASVFLSTYYTKPVKTPSLLMIYDMIPEYLGFDLSNAAWQLKHEAIRHASAYICISQNTANDLSEYFSLDPKKISIAHCGVDSNFKPASIEDIKAVQLKHGIDKPYFLFVGERAGYKNAGLLFSAMHKLPNPSNYQVICLGGNRKMELEYLPLITGLDVLMFRADDTDMNALYSGALALVYPSMYEGFGLPIVEAMSSGCPVITCAVGSIPEVAGEDVVYIEPDNTSQALEAMQAVQSFETRIKLIEAGLKRASLFSWSKMASDVKKIAENLI